MTTTNSTFRSSTLLAEVKGSMELSLCPKLRQGQLLMQRYKFVYALSRGGRYEAQGDVVKEKSLKLAQKMVDHARACRRCTPDDHNFYGLDLWM